MALPPPLLRSKWLPRLGWGACGLAFAGALVRAMSASHPVPPRRLSEAERTTVGRLCAAEEPRWRLSTMHRFPGDHWSQDDDFHASERGWALELSRREGVSPTEVFRAIDEELHAQPVAPPRKASASPSKPRPFYD
ncbi:hypothetical protein [Stigmatella hybrida]|uniref:hypothetical protein n=1 Tax=Stigmatella hybrida TaxID=394097 RepID=UPI001CDA6E55|nr:hypothetical protein [Stigmatella hybrida]